MWASVCDVASEVTVAGTLSRFGRLDIVVDKAGLLEFKALKDLTRADWLRTLEVGLLDTFHFIKQAFTRMKTRRQYRERV